MDWQDLSAIVIVATAVFYLLLGLFMKRDATPSCGSSCGGCGKSDEPSLVTLSPKQ